MTQESDSKGEEETGPDDRLHDLVVAFFSAPTRIEEHRARRALLEEITRRVEDGAR